MKEFGTFIISWAAVTTIYFVTFTFDGFNIKSATLDNLYMLWLLVGVISGIYFIVVGVPIIYLLFKRKKISRANFMICGVLASIPMLIFSTLSKETEWIIATALSGIVGGLVFAILLPTEKNA